MEHNKPKAASQSGGKVKALRVLDTVDGYNVGWCDDMGVLGCENSYVSGQFV